MKRGQFAVEYLTTYGWVILSMVIAVSALAYFGVLSPSQYIPDRCNFGYQFVCEDFVLEKAGSDVTVKFKLRNNFGRTVNISSVEGIDSKRNITSCTQVPTAINVGDLGEFICEVNGTLLTGNKYAVPARVYFHRNASGAPMHSVAGEIYTKVRET